MKYAWFVIVGLIVLSMGVSASAQTQISIVANKDNTLYEDVSGNKSNGAGDNFFAGKTNQGFIRRGLVSFDEAAIPTNARVTNAVLTLNMSRSGSGDQTINLHRATALWGEGTSNANENEGSGAPSTTNDATWAHRFFNSAVWTSQGGDFSPTPSAGLAVGGVGAYTWTSTTTLVSDVQQWVTTPSTNFGWVVRGNESASATSKRFDTKDNPTVANRPTLAVTYQMAQFEFSLMVTDNAGGTQQLWTGVDPAATDGIDASLGEVERPPLPPSGVFDARFIGEDIGIPSMGQGLIRDYRQGTVATSGDRIHELKYQLGSGTSATISWSLPTWAQGRLAGTGLNPINVTMIGTDDTTLNSPNSGNRLLILTVTYTAPLPVQLVNFTGSVINQQGHIRLNWRTLTETNNYGFFVQKSLNGQLETYQTISELIPGHGTTLEPQNYTWTDVNPAAGTWYYRLKQVDLDGSVYYTEGIIPSGPTGVKEKSLPTEFGLNQNYPNPFNPTTNIEYALPRESNVKIEVYNLIGQRMATLLDAVRPAGVHSLKFDAKGFSSGLYFYRMTADGNVNLMKKMVLMR